MSYRKKKAASFFTWALLLSLLFHSIFLFITNRKSQKITSDSSHDAIEIVPDVETKKQIVETEKADNSKIDPKSKYLSEKNQKVEKETRALHTDDFRKNQGPGLPHEDNGEKPKTGEEFAKEETFKETLKNPLKDPSQSLKKKKTDTTTGVKRSWETLTMKDLNIYGDKGPYAASDDYLKDLMPGESTVLSTREFKYFGYYQRIKELLRQYWKPSIERKLSLAMHRGEQFVSRELVTRLLVFLDKEGGISKISKLSGSGVTDIDDAAIEAFHKAGPFPHPPQGIIEADGFVKIRWDFILKADLGPAIQFGMGGRGRGRPGMPRVY